MPEQIKKENQIKLDKREAVKGDPRLLALVWMHAECCSMIDKGKDPRKEVMDVFLRKVSKDLGWEDLQ